MFIRSTMCRMCDRWTMLHGEYKIGFFPSFTLLPYRTFIVVNRTQNHFIFFVQWTQTQLQQMKWMLDVGVCLISRSVLFVTQFENLTLHFQLHDSSLMFDDSGRMYVYMRVTNSFYEVISKLRQGTDLSFSVWCQMDVWHCVCVCVPLYICSCGIHYIFFLFILRVRLTSSATNGPKPENYFDFTSQNTAYITKFII